MKKIQLSVILLLLLCTKITAQHALPDNQLKFYLNEDGSRYIRLTGLAQVWLRHTTMNAGTTINGYETDQYNDISVRRLRFQLYGQLTDKIFFYTQFGQNNFNFRSPKYTGAFFHDAVLEYAVDMQKLSFGAGLTGWSGLARHAAPSIGSILTLDAPLYQQSTNGVNDQFIRKLSFYAKGQLGSFDYRLALTSPMTISSPVAPVTNSFSFSDEPPKMQLQGYFKYMFLDHESNMTAYHAGSYLGTKKVFNIGTGIIYQPEATWALNNSGETIYKDMVLVGLDVFYDTPLSASTAFTTYLAYSNYDFGPGYIRNVGVNNPATGANTAAPGGFGNAYPQIGTGNTFYGQGGYLFGDDVLSEDGQLQPFLAFQYSGYDYLDNWMLMYELGFNYLIHGKHGGKISFMYQSRPTYEMSADGIVPDTRRGMSVIQYQVSF